EATGGNVIELHVSLGLADQALLRATPVMKAPDRIGGHGLVGGDDAVVVGVVARSEQVELERPLDLSGNPLAQGDHAIVALPALGAPVNLGVGPLLVDRDPPPRGRLVDDGLQHWEALEGDADAEVDALLIQLVEDRFVEERRVDAGLELCFWGGGVHGLHAFEHERLGAVGVVHVSREMVEVEELPRLRDRAEQWVIAARPAPLGIVPDGGSLGVAARGQDRPIEVERDARELLQGEAPEDEFASRRADHDHVRFTGPGESTRQRRRIREPLNANEAVQQRIVDIVVALAQAPEAGEKVNDELQDQHVQAVGDALARSSKVVQEPASEVELLEQRLEQDHTRKRCEPLFLKSHHGQRMDARLNLLLANFHPRCLSVCSKDGSLGHLLIGLRRALPYVFLRLRSFFYATWGSIQRPPDLEEVIHVHRYGYYKHAHGGPESITTVNREVCMRTMATPSPLAHRKAPSPPAPAPARVRQRKPA